MNFDQKVLSFPGFKEGGLYNISILNVSRKLKKYVKLIYALSHLLFLQVTLDSVEESDNEVTYHIKAYGKNVLCFRSLSWNISIEKVSPKKNSG